jgi:hypothetical protein
VTHSRPENKHVRQTHSRPAYKHVRRSCRFTGARVSTFGEAALSLFNEVALIANVLVRQSCARSKSVVRSTHANTHAGAAAQVFDSHISVATSFLGVQYPCGATRVDRDASTHKCDAPAYDRPRRQCCWLHIHQILKAKCARTFSACVVHHADSPECLLCCVRMWSTHICTCVST